MYPKSVDLDQFSGFGESNGHTHSLEELCLDLGFASVDVRMIAGEYYLLNIDSWTPFMKIGQTMKESTATLTALGPSYIHDHHDDLEEIEELLDQAQETRDKFEGTVEQESQIESDLRSYLLFNRKDSGTEPWIDRVH